MTNKYQSEKIFNRRCISGVSFKCQLSTGLRNPFLVGLGCARMRRVGELVSFWSGQLLSASGQPRVSRPTVRRPCGSLSGSAGLISSAPLGWAQLPQLSGNGGCRHSSAVQPSWRAAALQLFAVAAAALLLSPQLVASAGPLSAHLLPLHWAPGSPASLSLTFSATLPPYLRRHSWLLLSARVPV